MRLESPIDSPPLDVNNVNANASSPAGLRSKELVPSLYQNIADHLQQAILNGSLGAGDRLPSVRAICTQFGVSPGTATQAFRLLETSMLIEARPKSGYFVRRITARLPVLETVQLTAPVGGMPETARIVSEFAALSEAANVAPFAAATPDRRLLPEVKIQSLIASINRRGGFNASYPSHVGTLAFRQQVARRLLNHGVQVTADDIVATEGCMEALSIALRRSGCARWKFPRIRVKEFRLRR
jgi:DNA-binding transcriptional MocR family regulator